MEDLSHTQKKQIHVYVPGYLHTEIRVAAAKKGITIAQWMIRAALEQLQIEKSSDERI